MNSLTSIFGKLKLKGNQIDESKIILIQKTWRGYQERKKYNSDFFPLLINLLKREEELLTNSFINIMKVCQKFPPAKNENKFVYGKLIERIIIEMINTKIRCHDLDKTHESGSEYKNDCYIPVGRKKFSIKASKSGGNITIINKRTRDDHSIYGINFVICHLKEKKIFMFTHQKNLDSFVKEDGAAIHYKGTIFKILKERGNFISFPENQKTSNFIEHELPKIKSINIYDVLWNLI